MEGNELKRQADLCVNLVLLSPAPGQSDIKIHPKEVMHTPFKLLSTFCWIYFIKERGREGESEGEAEWEEGRKREEEKVDG